MNDYNYTVVGLYKVLSPVIKFIFIPFSMINDNICIFFYSFEMKILESIATKLNGKIHERKVERIKNMKQNKKIKMTYTLVQS